MTLAFFCLSALELLGALDTSVSEQNKKDWIDWIYAQQIKLDAEGKKKKKKKEKSGKGPFILCADDVSQGLNKEHCGFRGSPCSGRDFDPHAVRRATGRKMNGD